MSWAKFDDRFHEHRKVKRVWRADPSAVGLHVMAVTYCCGHETDGLVDAEFVEEKMPRKADRERAVAALVEAGVWSVVPDGWQVHDYLDYNPSRADLEAKRAADAERKAKGRKTAAVRRESERRPVGLFADTSRTPRGVGAASSGPDPTRPDPVPPSPPRGELPPLPTRPGGKRARGLAAFEEQLQTYAELAFPNLEPTIATGMVRSAVSEPGATHETVANFVRRWHPDAAGHAGAAA